MAVCSQLQDVCRTSRGLEDSGALELPSPHCLQVQLFSADTGGSCAQMMASSEKTRALPPALSMARTIARDHELDALLSSTSFAELQV